MLNWRDPKNPKAGGAERVSMAFLKALVARGHEVAWFANEFPGAAKSEIIDGMQVVRGGGYGSSILAARRWYRTQKKFDLVIDQHHGLPWFAPWWSRTNTLAYIHEVLGPIWRSFYTWPLNWIGEIQETWTHRFYKRVPFLVPSESTARALRARGVQRVAVIPNGNDTPPLHELGPKPPIGTVKLITVCRLAPNKRVDHAIRVLQILNSELHCPSLLTIVGAGECLGDLERQSKQYGLEDKIRFAGSVSELEKNRELQAAHLLLHTSVREGWGLNVLEANAMGTPAVVYPVAGLVDSTLQGKTGLVTSTEDPREMAEEVMRLTNDPDRYGKLRETAWKRSERFRWEKILPLASEWFEAYARGQMPESPFPKGY